MSWNMLLGIISCIALLIPVALLVLFRLAAYRTFPLLLAYYSILLIDNLTGNGLLNPGGSFHYYWGLTNNLIEMPLLVLFLSYFTKDIRLLKFMYISVAAYLVYEIVMIAILGFNSSVLPFTIGPGLVVTFGFSLMLFIKQAKIAITNHKTTGKALILASFLFSAGCYFIIYIMYYVVRTKYKSDSFLIYFLVTTFSSLLLIFGIFIERRRVEKLNELQTTRRELESVYGPDKPVVKLRPLISEIPQEQWN